MIISSFIIQANVIMIINYDHKTFIIQATDENFFVKLIQLLFFRTRTQRKCEKLKMRRGIRGEAVHNMFYGDLKIIFLGTLS